MAVGGSARAAASRGVLDPGGEGAGNPAAHEAQVAQVAGDNDAVTGGAGGQ